jgi:hypothetical protein
MKQQLTIPAPQAAPVLLSSPITERVMTDIIRLQQSLQLLENESLASLPSSRRLKIQPLMREREDDIHHLVPGLNLNGEWLMRSGFIYHQHARIIPIEGMLVICPEKVP